MGPSQSSLNFPLSQSMTQRYGARLISHSCTSPMLVALCVLFFLQGVLGGPQSVDYSGVICGDVLKDTEIYHDPDTMPAQAVVEAGISSQLPLFTIGSKPCRIAASKYLCTSAFRPVIEGGQTLLPNTPCQSICEAFVANCETFLDETTTPDCAAVSNVTSPSTGDSLPCWDTQDDVQMVVDCPEPLQKGVDRVRYCDFGCPHPWFGTAWGPWKDIFCVCNLLAVLVLFVPIFTWSFYQKKKEFPSCLLLPMFWGVTIATLSIWAGAVVPSMCSKDGFPNDTQTSSWQCSLQGVSFHLGQSVGISWWMIIAINLNLSTVRGLLPHQAKTYMKRYQWIGYGIPALEVIICLGLGAYGYVDNGPWCFFNGASTEYSMWLFYYPTAVRIFVGSVALIQVLFHIKEIQRHSKAKWTTYVRPIIFNLGMVYLYSFAFGFRMQMYAETDDIKDAFGRWAACLLRGGDDTTCRKLVHTGPSLGLMWMMVLNSFVIGIIVALLFGLSTENLLLWKGTAKVLKDKRSASRQNSQLLKEQKSSSRMEQL